jgi:Cu2+-exporting ATPase
MALDSVETVAGQGIRGSLDGREFRIGKAAFAGQGGADSGHDGGTLWLSDAAGWLARFEIRDRLREGALETVERFKHSGMNLFILSGDAPVNVETVALELGIPAWRADQQPADKLELLESMKGEGKRLLMVGDGINDAPVLAAADVSMAVQGGSELANSAADLILTGRSLELVWTARELAVATRNIIKQNMIWAVLYNLVMIPLAATGLLQPWMAAIGMSASSLLVVLNAARLGSSGGAKEPPAASPGMGING